MVYLRTLGLYCEMNRTDPKALLKIASTKEFRDSFIDFVRSLERQGKAGFYIVRFKKVLRSWFAFNGLDVKLKVNIAGEYETPTIRGACSKQGRAGQEHTYGDSPWKILNSTHGLLRSTSGEHRKL